MAYTNYSYFTRKQCNVLYGAFKRGELVPPKDCLGKVKKPSFVYRYEHQHYLHGMRLSKDEILVNSQLAALEETIKRFRNGDVEGAQRVLNVEDEEFVWGWLPEGVEPQKFWRSVC